MRTSHRSRRDPPSLAYTALPTSGEVYDRGTTTHDILVGGGAALQRTSLLEPDMPSDFAIMVRAVQRPGSAPL